MERGRGTPLVLVGFVLIAWALLVGGAVSMLAWGGVWAMSLPERLAWFSPAILIGATGLCLITLGCFRTCQARLRPVRHGG